VEQRKNIPTGKYRIIVLFCLAESRLNTISQFLLLFAKILNRSTRGDIDGAFFLQIRYIKQIRHWENGTIYIMGNTGLRRRKNPGFF
jgi:hypothetical protein